MELKTLRQEIDNAKRSILYDLHKCVNDIKNTISMTGYGFVGTQLTQYTAELAITLPLNTVEQFIQFNEQLSADLDKEKAFVSFVEYNLLNKYTIRIHIYITYLHL